MFSDLSYSWLFVGFIILVIEFLFPTVVLLFIGLSTVTVGGLLFFNVLTDSNKIMQLITFFELIILWYLALFIPLKKIKISKLTNGDKNILDQRAEVVKPITKEKGGKVRWSGTKMKAILSRNNIKQRVEKGDVVRIVSIDKDILTVSSNH